MRPHWRAFCGSTELLSCYTSVTFTFFFDEADPRETKLETARSDCFILVWSDVCIAVLFCSSPLKEPGTQGPSLELCRAADAWESLTETVHNHCEGKGKIVRPESGWTQRGDAEAQR